MGRREAIGALGAMGAAFVLPSRSASRSGAALDCVVVPEMHRSAGQAGSSFRRRRDWTLFAP